MCAYISLTGHRASSVTARNWLDCVSESKLLIVWNSNRRNPEIGTVWLGSCLQPGLVTNRKLENQDSLQVTRATGPSNQSTTRTRVIVGRLNVAMTTETLVTKLNRKESLPSVPRLSKHVCSRYVCGKNDKTRRGMEGWNEGWELVEEFPLMWFPRYFTQSIPFPRKAFESIRKS